jgi:hypothetical protein
MAEARKSSDPVTLFEKIRQHACGVHNALKLHWKCPSRKCWSHNAHLSLRAETKAVILNVLFVLEGEQGSYSNPIKQEVIIQPAKDDAAAPPTTTQISYVQQGASFVTVQERFEDIKTTKKGSSFRRIFSKSRNTPLSPSSASSNDKLHSRREKLVHFATSTPTITISQDSQVQNPPATTAGISNFSSRHIGDLCSSLRDCPKPSFGVIVDEFDRQFQLSKSPKPGPATTAPDAARLVPLPELLDAYHEASIDISRQHRFEMAVHIASALLQVQMSPWLSTRWSKHDFYFLADSHSLYSNYPYVSQTFFSRTTDPPVQMTDTSILPSPPASEEDIRSSLSTIGVIILELIFGHNIESCNFRHHYYGANDQPNDQTDLCTARTWARKVLGECGAEINDVVRRCLDCSFGPKPRFEDKMFREAIYEGVIRPLADYQKTWQVNIS